MRTRAVCVLSLVVASVLTVQGYTINAPWRTPITYYINPSNSYGFTPEQVETAVALAAKAWMDADKNVTITYAGRTTLTGNNCGNGNVVYFNKTTATNLLAEAWSCYEYRTDPETGQSYKYRKYNTDIAIFEKTGTGGKRPFIINDRQCTPSGWYVQDVLTHEFGHLLGLGHVGLKIPTMYRALTKCLQTWRTLELDDFDGIKSLYPAVTEKYWRTRRPPRDGGDIGIE